MHEQPTTSSYQYMDHNAKIIIFTGSSVIYEIFLAHYLLSGQISEQTNIMLIFAHFCAQLTISVWEKNFGMNIYYFNT